MPTVPMYEGFSVQENSLPAARVSVPQVKNAAGTQLMQTGQALAGLGEQVGQIALSMQAQANRVRVEDAVNQAKDAALDLKFGRERGYTNLRGLNALERPDGKPLGDEYREYLGERFAGIEAGLGNDAQRMAFRQWADMYSMGFREELVQYEAQQFNAYSLSVADGVIANAQNTIGLEWHNQEVAEGEVGRIGAEVLRIGQLQGLSAEQIKANQRNAVSGAHVLVVMSALQNHDPAYADQYLNRYSEQMNADDLLKVRGMVTREMDIQVGFSVVSDVVASVQSQINPTPLDRLVNIAVGGQSSQVNSEAFSRLSADDRKLINDFQFDSRLDQSLRQASGGDEWVYDYLKTALTIENLGFGRIRTDAVNSRNTNGTSDHGAFQMNDATLAAYGLTAQDAQDFDKSLSAMVRYAQDAKRQYGGNMAAALAHYNAGTKAGNAVMEGRPPSNERYVNLAMALMGESGKERIRELIGLYEGDPQKALAAYQASADVVSEAIEQSRKPENAGRSWLEFTPQETQTYVRTSMQAYAQGLGRERRPSLRQIQDQIANDPRAANNSERQRIALEEARRQFEMQEAEIKQREEEAVRSAQIALQTNGGRYYDLPLELRNSIPPDKIPSLMEYGQNVNRIVLESNPEAYLMLTNTSYLRDSVKTESDLMLQITELSPADQKRVIGLWNEVHRPDVLDPNNTNSPNSIDTAAVDRARNQRLLSFGINPNRTNNKSENETLGRLQIAIDSAILSRQRQFGRRLTDAEINDTMDIVFTSVVQERWFGLSTTSTPAIAIQVSDIPPDRRAVLKQALAIQGIYNPTDAQIVEANSFFVGAQDRRSAEEAYRAEEEEARTAPARAEEQRRREEERLRELQEKLRAVEETNRNITEAFYRDFGDIE